MTVIRIILSFIICTIGWVTGFFGVQVSMDFMPKVLLVLACILIVFVGMVINDSDYRMEIGEMGLIIVPIYAILFPVLGPVFLIKGILGNVDFPSRGDKEERERKKEIRQRRGKKAKKIFIVIRVLLGTLIVILGYAVCFSGLGSIELLLTMAIGDLILLLGVIIAYGRYEKGEATHYTSTAGMIFGWLFKILIQPVLALIAMIVLYKQLLTGGLTSDDGDYESSSYTDPDDYVDNTGIKTGGMRKLKSEIGSLCHQCQAYANSHYISGEIKYVTPSFLSHMIDLKITLTIETRNLQSESDVSHAKSAVEDYFSRVTDRIQSLQQSILHKIEMLVNDGYNELAGNWKVEAKYSYSIDGKWYSA